MMGLNDTLNSSSSNDDELTNLTWLQDNNLLQNMTHNDDESTTSESSVRGLKEDNENVSPKKIKINLDSSIKDIDLDNNIITTSSGTTIPCAVPPVRYNPLLHTHTKPPYSFSSLIFMAIENSPIKALPVKDIYNWIVKNFPYYKEAPDGWKNTVRHNLSLNKCFQKIEKGKKVKDSTSDKDKLLNDQLASKGSLWCVDPELRPNLLQSIKKTPAHIYPYMSTAKTGTNLVQISNIINSSNDNQSNSNPNKIDLNNITTVTIGNQNNISLPSNNQSPKKIISLEKLPQKNVLTTAKRVLIPITKTGREQADAAESMLALTQCSTTGSLNSGNIYILTNKGENLVPIQLSKPTFISGTTATIKQQSPVKNQIAFITQPIIQTSTISQPTTITLRPTVSKNATIITPVSTSQFTTSTDHNYSSRGSTLKAITIPASSFGKVSGQQIILNSLGAKSNLVTINRNIGNKIITITTNPSPLKNVITKTIVTKAALPVVAKKDSEKQSPNKKQKVDVVNDEDGLKCAEALFNLANGSTGKLTKQQINAEKKDKNELNKPKTKTITIQTVSTPSSTITRSTAKKLKTSV